MNAFVDQLVEQHNDGALELSTEAVGYEIVSVTVYPRRDDLNLPAYRHEIVIVARWQDEHSTRPLAETFDGYGPTWELAEQQAAQAYNAWRTRLNVIGQWNSKRAVS